MDNDVSMNCTCCQPLETASQEFAQEDTEEENESFFEPTLRKRRGTNLSQREDEALCNAWRRIGIDPIVGNEQHRSTYWDRINELYKLILKCDMPSSVGSLQHHFLSLTSIVQMVMFAWLGMIVSVQVGLMWMMK
jgi:hypothetical protein